MTNKTEDSIQKTEYDLLQESLPWNEREYITLQTVRGSFKDRQKNLIYNHWYGAFNRKKRFLYHIGIEKEYAKTNLIKEYGEYLELDLIESFVNSCWGK